MAFAASKRFSTIVVFSGISWEFWVGFIEEKRKGRSSCRVQITTFRYPLLVRIWLMCLESSPPKEYIYISSMILAKQAVPIDDWS